METIQQAYYIIHSLFTIAPVVESHSRECSFPRFHLKFFAQWRLLPFNYRNTLRMNPLEILD